MAIKKGKLPSYIFTTSEWFKRKGGGTSQETTQGFGGQDKNSILKLPFSLLQALYWVLHMWYSFLSIGTYCGPLLYM